MRNQFAQQLVELFQQHSQLVLLYADIGNRLFNPLKAIAPERVINVGIAEANMVSVAAGMAKMGFYPILYTITPFTTSRCYEQIKIDLAYAHLPCLIVGTGSGLAYANLGPTHHSFEDIAIMRVLPQFEIFAPADSIELQSLLPQIITSQQPSYLRIGKKGEPQLHPSALVEYSRHQPIALTSGHDLAILATGTILAEAIALQQQLQTIQLQAALYSFPCIKPLADTELLAIAKQYQHIVTLEEHSRLGGFGSAILEKLNDHHLTCFVDRFGLADTFIDQVHNRTQALEKAGLTLPIMIQTIQKTRALL